MIGKVLGELLYNSSVIAGSFLMKLCLFDHNFTGNILKTSSLKCEVSVHEEHRKVF